MHLDSSKSPLKGQSSNCKGFFCFVLFCFVFVFFFNVGPMWPIISKQAWQLYTGFECPLLPPPYTVPSIRNSGCPFAWDNQNQLWTTTNDAEVVRQTTKGLHQKVTILSDIFALFVKTRWFSPSIVNVLVFLKQYYSNLVQLCTQ